MKVAKVSPNRMELLKNKRKLALATRGHKLLKEKYDEMVKRFHSYLELHKDLREQTEEQITNLYKRFSSLRAQSQLYEIRSLTRRILLDTRIEVKNKNLLNTLVPEISFSSNRKTNYLKSAAPLALNPYLKELQKTLEQIAKLAEFEQTARTLAIEIEKTRRRVNALEHVLMPTLKSNIRFISMKMDEMERENRTRFMRTKELLIFES